MNNTILLNNNNKLKNIIKFYDYNIILKKILNKNNHYNFLCYHNLLDKNLKNYINFNKNKYNFLNFYFYIFINKKIKFINFFFENNINFKKIQKYFKNSLLYFIIKSKNIYYYYLNLNNNNKYFFNKNLNIFLKNIQNYIYILIIKNKKNVN